MTVLEQQLQCHYGEFIQLEFIIFAVILSPYILLTSTTQKHC